MTTEVPDARVSGAPQSAEDELLCTIDSFVAIITMNRPSALNALTIGMVTDLHRLCGELQADAHVRAVVLTGAGDRAFCVGGDLREFIPVMTSGGLDLLVPNVQERFFSTLYKPIIAAVNGICVGGGLELLLGTDIRIAEEGTTFGLPEVRWGVIPGAGAHVRLPAQLGWAVAMELLLVGDSIDCDRAREVGLINHVVPKGTSLDRAVALARRIAQNAPLAVATAKEIAVRALHQEAGFAFEAAMNERVLRSDDAREGPRAFAERRAPNYTGR